LYVQSIEDRAHQEIDRARQEAKQWQQRFEASERNHLAAATELEAQRDTARDQLRVADKDIARQAGQIAALEKALADAHSRVPQKRTPQKRKPQRVPSGPAAKRGPRKKAPVGPRLDD
jgi:chromosome segregation ATPase